MTVTFQIKYVIAFMYSPYVTYKPVFSRQRIGQTCAFQLARINMFL